MTDLATIVQDRDCATVPDLVDQGTTIFRLALVVLHLPYEHPFRAEALRITNLRRNLNPLLLARPEFLRIYHPMSLVPESSRRYLIGSYPAIPKPVTVLNYSPFTGNTCRFSILKNYAQFRMMREHTYLTGRQSDPNASVLSCRPSLRIP